MKITVFLVIFVASGMAMGISSLSYASTNPPIAAFYNCEHYEETKVTCYPSRIHVNGSETTGISQKIYTLSSNEAEYSDG